MQRAKVFLAEWMCLTWIKDKLGLRKIRRAYTGGAALGPDIFRFFHALGVNLKQIYGQTEVSGISVVHRDDDIKFQTVGTPLPGTEIKIADDWRDPGQEPGRLSWATTTTPRPRPRRSRTAGCTRATPATSTKTAIWCVIDRAKDVMTLARRHAGSRPQFIENKLKFSPYIREAVVFGGDWLRIRHLAGDDRLLANAGKWAEKRQIPYTTFTDLAQKDEVYDLVHDYVEQTNDDLPGAAKIARFLLLYKELDADDDELTRTRKVRRRFVADRYSDLLGALYSPAESIKITNEISYQDGTTAQIETELRIDTLIDPAELTSASADSEVGG